MLIKQFGLGYAKGVIPGTDYVLSERAKGAKTIHFIGMVRLKNPADIFSGFQDFSFVFLRTIPCLKRHRVPRG